MGRPKTAPDVLIILPEIEDEARRLVDEATERKIVVRLLGGLGVAVRCPSARVDPLKRNYADIDLIGHERQSRALADLLVGMGYKPRARFNALNGKKRLIFNDLSNDRRVDVFLDTFEMSHNFNFSKRLEVDRVTLPLADLLATKLQVYEVNEKDLRDMTALFLDHDIGPSDGETINWPYLAKICGGDWGIYKTFTTNLSRLESAVEGFGLPTSQVSVVKQRTNRLRETIEAEPKTAGWRLRARVGEKVQWYELPEPDQPVVAD